MAARTICTWGTHVLLCCRRCAALRACRYVWGSLLPIVGGCSLSAMKEVSFSWGGFNNAMISNLGMVLRNIYSKKSLNDYKVGWQLGVVMSDSGYWHAWVRMYFPVCCDAGRLSADLMTC